MGGIINPSTLQSIVKYIQGLAITLKIYTANLPEKFRKFIDAITNFFLNVWRYLPEIPDFDVRFGLIVLTFGIPVLLDFICTLVYGDLLHNFLHMLDIAASFALLYNIAYLVMTKSKPVSTIIIISVCIIYLIIRGIILIINQIKQYRHNIETSDLSLQSIITNIEKYYMKDIIPGILIDYTEDDLENQIAQFNKQFIYNLVQPNALNVSILIILFLGLLALILYLFGVFTPINLPPFVKYSFISVLILFEIIFVAVFIMIVFESLREPFLIIRNFVRRYGVKFVLLIMDFIYIPVAESIISNLEYTKTPCEQGYYPYSDISTNQSLAFFINHNTTCTPCTIQSNSCNDYCSQSVLYSTMSPHLRLIQDILPTTMPNIAFGFFFIIIGLPVLTFITVLRTRSIVCQIPAFGRTLAIKWNCIVNKLNTPGLFSFYMYKYNLYLWSVLVSVQKLLLVVLSELTELVNRNIIYAMTVIYFVFFILYIVLRPFQYSFNNILEIIMAICNCLMTLVPILSMYGKNFPSWLSVPLSVLVCVLPIIAVPYSLIRKTDLHGKEDEGINILDEELDPCRIIDLKMIDVMAIWQMLAEKEFDPNFDPNDSDRSENEDKNAQNNQSPQINQNNAQYYQNPYYQYYQNPNYQYYQNQYYQYYQQNQLQNNGQFNQQTPFNHNQMQMYGQFNQAQLQNNGQFNQNNQFNQAQLQNNGQFNQGQIHNIEYLHNSNADKLADNSSGDASENELNDSLEQIPVVNENNQQQQYYYAPQQTDYFFANQNQVPMSYANFVFDEHGKMVLKVMAGNLIGKVDSMYEMIDKVCDAATTYGIVLALKLVSIISAMCTGWFFGSIIGKQDVFELLIC